MTESTQLDILNCLWDSYPKLSRIELNYCKYKFNLIKHNKSVEITSIELWPYII